MNVAWAAQPAVVAAVASMVAAVGVAVAAVVGADEGLRPVAGVVAGAGVALLLGALLTGHSWLTGWALAGLVAAYACAVGGAGGALQLRAPLVGAALFLAGEAAFWSFDLRRAQGTAPGVVAVRIGYLAGVAALSVAGGVALLWIGTVDPGWGLTAEAAGVVAAAGVAVVAVSGARQSG